MTLAIIAAGLACYSAIISAYAYGQALQLRKLRDLMEHFNRRPHSQDVSGPDPYVTKAANR